jgi:hypothetical protein
MHPMLRAQLEVLQPYSNAMSDAVTPAQKSAAAEAARAEAEARYLDNRPYFSDLLALAADGFLSAGDTTQAISVYGRLATIGANARWRAHGYLRRGQTQPASDSAARIADFTQSVQVLSAAQEQLNALMTYRVAVKEWSTELSRTGDYAGALATRAQLRANTAVWAAMDDASRGETLIANARDYCKLANPANAENEWEDLESEAPQFGIEDGSIVLFLIERAGSCHPINTATSEDALGKLQKIWQEERFSSMPEVMNCGIHIVDKLSRMQRIDDSRAWRVLVLERWDKMQGAWQETASADRWKQAFTEYASEVVGRMSDLEVARDWEGMVLLGDAFLDKFPDADVAPFVESARDRALTHL